ncbi:electron transfer flavoprotein beta subunit [Salana multivorans]|uniref:Electron transfer flavoprotein small subunit n=1 Tax=Salana multivorans TaxID=120377 RepID=A0A3N2DDB7_9MICO|nr:electron transfer flavoprotein beta subunit/FixA family protein [Salana multivorans]ROR97732.1 electron transfer flavoprotein beta subunit [Salana multivorans]
MSTVVAYKWSANPQDAVVGSDGTVDWSRAKAGVGEYDTIPIELGRRLADATGDELVGVSVGPAAVASPMAKKAALSRGLDRAVVLADDAVAGWNLTRVAAALAALADRAGATIVLTGDASVDENAKMTSALVAGSLGWPCFQDVSEVARTDDGWRLTQVVSGGTREIEVSGGVVVAVTTDAVVPRVPGMKEILAAGKKPVDEVSVSEIELPEAALEIQGRARPVMATRKHHVFGGTDAVNQLVAAMRADGAI